MTRTADLEPPLGYPGGPCYVVQRIMEEVRDTRLQGELVEDVERGQALSNADASKVYDLEVERGPANTRFKEMALTAHAQYRMDQRGITVTELRLALSSFQKRWSDLKSRGDPQAKRWESDMAYGESILWVDPKIKLAVAFIVRSGSAQILTAYWDGHPDPKPGVCHLAYRGPPESGFKTLVHPKSEKNLPTDIDREKERVLPPGAATPNSPSAEGGGGSGGTGARGIQKFVENKPDNDIPDRPRTLPERGEDRGVQYKEDYGYVTRRTMKGSAAVVADRFLDRHAKTCPACGDKYGSHIDFCFNDGESLTGVNPSAFSVAAAFLREAYTAPKVIPPTKRQKRQQGPDKMDSRREYLHERPRKNRQMKRRHKRLMRNQQYRKYKKWYNDNYRARGERRFRRRAFSFEEFDAMVTRVAEGITFTFDREAPNKEINHPGPNVGYAPTSPTHQKHKPDEKEGLPKGETGPEKHLDDADAGSTRVVPPGDGTLWKGEETYVKAASIRVASRWLDAASIADIDRQSDALSHSRATQVGAVKVVRSDPKNGLWTFSVVGSRGNKTYTVKVKGVRKGRTLDVSKLDVRVSCSCPAFRWQGPEHWAKVEAYQQGKPQGTATFPIIRDPDHNHSACKHVLAIFKRMPQLFLDPR